MFQPHEDGLPKIGVRRHPDPEKRNHMIVECEDFQVDVYAGWIGAQLKTEYQLAWHGKMASTLPDFQEYLENCVKISYYGTAYPVYSEWIPPPSKKKT